MTDVPDRSSSRPGPLRVTWTGGSPESAHDAASGWLATPRGSAVTVDVPAGTGTRRLEL